MNKKTYIDRDQFYTKKSTVDICMRIFSEFINKNNINLEDYILVEPSVGSGNFYNEFPQGVKKISIDLYPDKNFIENNTLINTNYLDFTPDISNGKRYIVLGNPPFGKQGDLVKKFIEHSASYADYIFFIMPMGINSNIFKNKLIDELRYDMVEWHPLPTNSFVFPNNEECLIDTGFGILTFVNDTNKKYQSKKKEKNMAGFSINHINLNDIKKPYNKKEVYHIGEQFIEGADLYLPHIAYKNKLDKFKFYKTFKELESNVG
jgi:hypothetical protein